jgi:integrase
LENRRITITGSVGVVDGKRVAGTTKSGRTRVVAVDDETVKVLQDQRRAQEIDRETAGDAWRGEQDGLVFTTGWGEPLFPDTVTALMRKLINAYNQDQDGKPHADPLPPARLHDLRHIHATTLLLAGVPVHVVAARLGHADPAITLRVYAHIVGAVEEQTAEIFADALKNAP